MKLWLMVGVSGSGKSTLAKQFADSGLAVVVSADDWFVTPIGYRFDPTQLEAAHQSCFNRARFYLQQGQTVVVDNTNLSRWERDRYHKLSQELFKVDAVEIWLPQLPVAELAKRNTHGLTEKQIEKQLSRLED